MNYHDHYYLINDKIKLELDQCDQCQEKFNSYYFRYTDNKSILYETIVTICKNTHYIDNKMYVK